MLQEKRFIVKKNVDPESRAALVPRLAEILGSRKNLAFGYLYGSFVRNEPFRDVDIAVYVVGESGLETELSLSAELSNILGYEADVRLLNSAPIEFGMSVLREGTLLFSRDEEARADFIELVGQRYREYAHFRNAFLGLEGTFCEFRPES
jgi:predicted nucleotidyltransferase